jgi:hypothetical protein
MDFRHIFGAISLKKFFVENPKLMLKNLGQDGSGSAEFFTTDSLNDKEQNVRIEFSLGVLSFFFVNCKVREIQNLSKLIFSMIYTSLDRAHQTE